MKAMCVGNSRGAISLAHARQKLSYNCESKRKWERVLTAVSKLLTHASDTLGLVTSGKVWVALHCGGLLSPGKRCTVVAFFFFFARWRCTMATRFHQGGIALWLLAFTTLFCDCSLLLG